MIASGWSCEHGQYSLTMLNRYPYNNGHLLIAPNRHVARLDQLEAAEQLDLVQRSPG